MVIGNDTVHTSNFEKNQQKSLELLGVEQAIDSYIDFSLLKQYALKHNVKDSPAYQIELVKQGEKLKDSLYYPTEVLEPLLQDYYQKIMTEKKVQLLTFKGDVLPKNKNQHGKFIDSVIKKINDNTLNFEEAVEHYSSVEYFKKPTYLDPLSPDKNLTDAIYKAPLNKVTQYEFMDVYYLILVSGERKYLGEVVLDEIFIRDTTEAGKAKAERAYEELRQGKSFSEVKQEYQQNINDRSQGEGFYTDIQNDEVYEYVRREININTSTHEASQPIRLENGYAIYKYFFRENYDLYAYARNKIYTRLKKSAEAESLNNILINELKGYSFFRENTDNISRFINSLPATYGQFQNMEFTDELILVDIGEELQLTDKMVWEQLNKLSKEEYPNSKLFARYAVYDWERVALLDYYKTHFYELDRIKDSWKNLEDQLLIKFAFSIIADQAQRDIEGQEEFLRTEASRLTWKERIQGTFYYCLNSDVEKEVLQMLKNKKSAEYIKNHFRGKTDSDKNELLLINQGKFTRESVNLPPNEKLSKKIYTVESKNRRLVIQIDKIIANDKMSLKELQTTYINEYIDYKSARILEQLKKETVININPAQKKILEERYPR
jgi:hypothetical protein